MAGRTSARAVSRYGRLRNRQSGVRAVLLDRDDEIRSEETQRRLEIDAGDGGFGRFPGVWPVWLRSACPRSGAAVAWLPGDYQGPLKLNDRIVAVAGKELRDGREYAQ